MQAIMKDLEAAGWKKAVEKKKDEITELDIKVPKLFFTFFREPFHD
jgi:hypothetical protein